MSSNTGDTKRKIAKIGLGKMISKPGEEFARFEETVIYEDELKPESHPPHCETEESLD